MCSSSAHPIVDVDGSVGKHGAAGRCPAAAYDDFQAGEFALVLAVEGIDSVLVGMMACVPIIWLTICSFGCTLLYREAQKLGRACLPFL